MDGIGCDIMVGTVAPVQDGKAAMAKFNADRTDHNQDRRWTDDPAATEARITPRR